MRDKIWGDMGVEMPANDILCRKCKYRQPDVQLDGFGTVLGYKKGECAKYTNKPNGILFMNEKCRYFEE